MPAPSSAGSGTVATRAPRRSSTVRVALLIESSRAFGRGVLNAVAECLRARRHWLVYYQEGGLGELVPRWFEGWEGDGIIARVEDMRMGRALARKRIPIVDVRGGVPLPGVPVVKTDNVEIARLAAEHLLERGFRWFAYCGYEGSEYSTCRGEVFARLIRDAGFPCRIFSAREPRFAKVRTEEQYGWAHEQNLMAWLGLLPKPIGLMACNDARGHQILNAAHRLGISVPDEMAVVGVDNHQTVCELTTPPLSSVEQNTHQIAGIAVQLLDDLLQGRPPPAAPILVKPCKVVHRRSTDVLAIPDRNLRKAIRCIRTNATSGIGVDDVARAAGLSRRELERRFSAAFGHPPGQELIAAQVRVVKALLTETDWPLYRIAEKAGFAHAEYLNVAFKRHFGITPRKYRLQMGRRT